MKKTDKILNCLIVCAIVFAIVFQCVNNYKKKMEKRAVGKSAELTTESVKSKFPKASSLVPIDTSYYKIVDSQRKVLGKVVASSPFTDDIVGFAGNIPLTIILDNDNRIIEVIVNENQETPHYLRNVIDEGLLESWNGLTPAEAVEKQVDAVSGATFSSRAIIKSVQKRMTVMSHQNTPKAKWDWSLFLRQICVLIVTALALVCFFNPKKTKTLRYFTLFLSVCILGFWNNSLLSLALFFNWLANGVSLAVQIPILIIALVAILLPLFTKKSFYCAYLCPFGALQEFTGELVGEKVKVSAKAMQAILWIRKIILLAIIVVVAMGLGLDPAFVEPFSAFNWQSVGFGMSVFAIAILMLSVFIRKPWCNFLCPTGLLLELIRRIRNKSQNE